MPLTSQDKVDVRRFCGYGFYGSTGNVSLMYYRYFPQYNTLEYRLNNLSDDEVNVLQQNYIPKLNQLEQDLYTMRDALIVDTAAVFHRNMNEIDDREGLLTYYKRLLMSVLQIPPGPWYVGGGNSARMIV